MFDGVLPPIAELDRFVEEIIIVSILNVTHQRRETSRRDVFSTDLHSHHPSDGPWGQGELHGKRRRPLLAVVSKLRLRPSFAMPMRLPPPSSPSYLREYMF